MTKLRRQKRPTWRLAINGAMWQPEGASEWFARVEYLATLQELARQTTAPRIREAFFELDRLADEWSGAGQSPGLIAWAREYGFLDAWLVELWTDTLDLRSLSPEDRALWEIAWPPFTHFDEQDELGTPKRTFKHFRWLALYQVGGLTYEQLAALEQGKAGLDISTISRALTATAKLIGLTLRPAPRRR